MQRQWKLYLLALTFVLLGVFALTPNSRVKADDDQGKTFTTEDVRGPYGFSFQGTVGGVPAAAVGHAVADGKGNFTDTVRTLSLNGVVSHQIATGTYTVNPNGTGSALFEVTFGPGVIVTETFDFVIVKNGKEVLFVGTNSGVVASGVAVRQTTEGH